MKLLSSLHYAIISSSQAGTVPTVFKRASVNDVATVGYATLNGGTSGGSGGPVTTVSTLDELTAAVAGDDPKVVIVQGTITGGDVVEIGSNTSVLGASGATLVGVGLRVLEKENVIIRNLIIQKVLAPGDNIGIQQANNVWVDHVDLSSNYTFNNNINSYDGLLDITHGCTGVTVTNSFLHDHWKASLIGHSDSNGAQDKAITVTMANNYWLNLNSRTPSFRFGTGHIFNSVFDDNDDGINTRDGAQLLVENSVWSGATKAIKSTDDGFAVSENNEFNGATDTAATGTFTDPPYDFSLIDVDSVRDAVVGTAGATLDFSA
ncbi:polysaccharide lyase family 1 protein [Fomitiporia mediterranea MF3/22]|uniref:polysaccharide lyase family 1 protein n=1 Tax=Fomitiporia mediterranea (strain MF3/22) TaxID=694068 RepID=UPI0004407EE6|nr:polysaccharide lyase family 1 protein [Fomitiporia mediterranea MF3/22]EJD06337.1 polysaccharide lyase family 1 protein [Fomitiporia mediterranea MF3/22]